MFDMCACGVLYVIYGITKKLAYGAGPIVVNTKGRNNKSRSHIVGPSIGSAGAITARRRHVSRYISASVSRTHCPTTASNVVLKVVLARHSPAPLQMCSEQSCFASAAGVDPPEPHH